MSYLEFWRHFFDFEERDVSPSGEIAVNCPFHPWTTGKDDENPSMHVNVETGKYICRSCPPTTDTDSSRPSGQGYSVTFGLRTSGDAEAFAMSYYDIRFPTARAIVSLLCDGTEEIPFPVGEERILGWQRALDNATKIREILSERKKLEPETIRKYELGWDGHRITIPVRNYRGDCVNVRRYDPAPKKKPNGKPNGKMISLEVQEYMVPSPDGEGEHVVAIRYGEPRLYPSSEMLPPRLSPLSSAVPASIFLMAGEWDTLLARQYGLHAFTFTGGEGTWKQEWCATFAGYNVFVTYDADRAGRSGALRVARSLHEAGVRVRIVALPLDGDKDKENKDFTDWIRKTSPSSGEEVYASLVGLSREYEAPSVAKDTVVSSGAEIQDVSLLDASYDPSWQGKKTRIRAMVTGKDLTPYTTIREATITCDKMDADNPLCKGCSVNFAAGRLDVEIGPDQDILRLIKVNDESSTAELRRIVGIPGKCPKWKIEVLSSQNVEQVIVSPEVAAGSFNSLDTEHTMQEAYYVYPPGAARLEANQTYEMEGVRTTEPWKQHVVHVVNAVKPVQDTISAFVLNERVRDNLVRFKPHPGQSHTDKFRDVAIRLTRDVTHIYGREDLVVGILLTYASVQQFRFQGQPVDNGLVETLIIGDTRTGKSETAFRLATFFGLGDVVTGEATTFAGLVGGLQAGVDGHWTVTWGKIPQNNGKLLVIDEASGLHTLEIERMSGIRSSRIAELVKIRQARTNARTRLLWMSNPRANRPLRSYSHGIEAVPELIGKPEDVARFDLVLSCASGEISDEVINQLVVSPEAREGPSVADGGRTGQSGNWGSDTHGERIGGKLPSPGVGEDGASALSTESYGIRGSGDLSREAFRDLILWAWSRRMDQIEYTKEAAAETLKAALEMGRKYSSSIPIVESANQRIKVARVAVAAAALSASVGNTEDTILVLPEHVRFAQSFMDGAYAKPSLDYAGYSAQEKEDERIGEDSRVKMTAWAMRNRQVAEVLSRNATFAAKDLEEQLNADKEQVKDAINRLIASRMIERTTDGHGYRKTAVFISIMKDLKESESAPTTVPVPAPG